MAENNEQTGILQPGQIIRPIIDSEEVPDLVFRYFGLTAVNIKELNSYDDKNFYIEISPEVKNPHFNSEKNSENASKKSFVLKILNSMDSKDEKLVQGQNEYMKFLNLKGFEVPVPVKNLDGNDYILAEIKQNNGDTLVNKHIIRLLTYISGIPQSCIPNTSKLAYQSGETIAKINNELKSFHNERVRHRNFIWALDCTPKLSEFVEAVNDHENRRIIHEILHEWEQTVVPILPKLERGFIHGDYNDNNILVNSDENDPSNYKITGVLDFGDVHFSCYVFELGVTIMYQMIMGKIEDCIDIGGFVLAGYLNHRDITDDEWSILKECICARFAQSLVMGAYSYQQDPGNHYLLATSEKGWPILRALWGTPKTEIYKTWKHIIGEYKNKM